MFHKYMAAAPFRHWLYARAGDVASPRPDTMEPFRLFGAPDISHLPSPQHWHLIKPTHQTARDIASPSRFTTSQYEIITSSRRSRAAPCTHMGTMMIAHIVATLGTLCN